MISKRNLAERLAMIELMVDDLDDSFIDLEKRLKKIEKGKKNDKVSK